MSFDLREYQIEFYEKIREAIKSGSNKILGQAPTGSGKTVVIAKMLGTAASRGYRAWFLVHRRELIKQSVQTLTDSAGIPLGIVAAGFPGNRREPIQVCSVQTLTKRRHLLDDPQLIIVDEAHHTPAASWGSLISMYPNAVIIGLTATPERLDGTGLNKYFDKLVTGPSVSWLIQNKYLSDYRMFAPNVPDLSEVHTLGGDYNKKELSAVLTGSAVVGDALGHYKKHAAGKRAVCFMWSVESSIEMAKRFVEAGIPAVHIDGTTREDERDSAIDKFRSGEIKVLSNVEIVSEGFDLPAIEAAFLLRPTQSLALYLQQVGRALRPFEGKSEALIFDHAGNCRRHGLPDDEREWSLEGRNKKKKASDECPIKQCPQCYAVLPAPAGVCKWCGFKFQKIGRGIDEVSGELKEMDLEAERAKRKAELRAAVTEEDLLALGTRRGYTNPDKWAMHILGYRRKYEQESRERDRQAVEKLKQNVAARPKDWI